jgi:hypothetical protein
MREFTCTYVYSVIMGCSLGGIGGLLILDVFWIRGTVLAFLVPPWALLGRTSIPSIKAKGKNG